MNFLKHLSVYTFVSFLGAGISFFLVPYLSYYIKPAEYGILSLLSTFVTILVPFIGLTASGLVTVEYYRIKDKKEYARLFSSIQILPVAPFLFFLLLTILFPDLFARFFEIPPEKKNWIILSVPIALFTIYYETLLAFSIIEKKPLIYALFNVSRLLLEVGLTILLITRFGFGWEGRLMSLLITTTIMTIIGFIFFFRKKLLTTKISWHYIHTGLLFGLPLILHTVGKFLINQSDRIFIAKMISLDEAGIYNIGYQVGMIMLLIVNAMGNFFRPFLFERLSDLTYTAKQNIVKMGYTLVGLMFFILIIMTVGAPFFFKWFVSEQYQRGTIFVSWIGLSYVFWGIYIIFSGFIFYTKKTTILAWLAVVNVILNLGLNYFLIKKFGAMGAAYATCISCFVLAVIIIGIVDKMYKLPWFKFKLQKALS